MCYKIVLISYLCCLPCTIHAKQDNARIKRNHIPDVSTMQSNQEKNVNFWLHTRITTDQIKSQVADEKLFGGLYDSQRQTIVLMTGYQNNPAKYGFFNYTATDYLAAFDGNVIGVFWDAGQGNYTEARAPVRDVALVLAQFLKRMAAEESLDLQTLTVAGFGMGAHIAGIAGRLLGGKIHTMIGLDPLNPLFVPGSSDVIDKYSAQFVQIIHTSASAEGIIEPLGHADFYPNNGFPPQPGCGSLPDYQWTICSHNRSYAFYSETFKKPSAFLGRIYSSYEEFQKGHCDGKPKAYMGYGTSRSARGVYYLQTRSSPPFGEGGSNSSNSNEDKAQKGTSKGGKRRKGRNIHPDAKSIKSSEENRVHFHLISRETKESPVISNINDHKLFNGAYDPSKPTVLLIPGYLMGPANSSFVDTMVEAHLSVSDMSLIAIFWDVAFDDYRVSSSKTFDVAVVVAQFIDRMANEESLEFGSLTLIGHSSGAQIGGTAGRLTKGTIANVIVADIVQSGYWLDRMSEISHQEAPEFHNVYKINGGIDLHKYSLRSLDPARPLFRAGGGNVIDRHSGRFVQIIHTAGTTLGIMDPLSHADFYVNSGLPPQPGCESVDFLLPVNPFAATCSHLLRVVDLYAESIGNPVAFPASHCHSYEKYLSGGCSKHVIEFMGYATSRHARGTFYLQTRASPPYGLGTGS